MRFNAFEGGRRILQLTMVLYALGVGFFVWNNDPYVSMTFTKLGPSFSPVYSEEATCGTDDAREYFSREFAKGKSVSITLCFKSVGEGGRKGIPYAVDPADKKMWLVDDKYSRDVLQYMKQAEMAFILFDADKERAQKLWKKSRKENFGEGALWFTGGVIFLWVFGAVVGWIVRGFASIPTGQDSRTQ